VEGCRLAVTDEEREEAVWASVSANQLLTGLFVGFKPENPPASSIYQGLIRRFLEKCGPNVENINLEVLGKKI